MIIKSGSAIATPCDIPPKGGSRDADSKSPLGVERWLCHLEYVFWLKEPENNYHSAPFGSREMNTPQK